VIDRLIDATWKSDFTSEASRAIDNVLLYRLMALAQNQQASEQAKAIAYMKLDDLRKWAVARQSGDPGERMHYLYAAAQIERFQNDPKEIPVAKPAEAPDGPPI
jgi:hypothetical protein